MSPYKSLRDSTGQAGGYNKKRIVVAMSGGVDSSVAAALLKKQGYEVAGVFMRFWAESQNHAELGGAEFTRPNFTKVKFVAGKRGNENLCCSEGAEKAARLVAAKLKIPFYVFNFTKEFKKEVVDYFLTEQAAGRTPNPCVVCNKKIKFGMLFQRALGVGADFIATGHYAWLTPNNAELLRRSALTSASFCVEDKTKCKKQNLSAEPHRKLLRAADGNKDQSYFLHQLDQKQLSRIIFPLADYTKDKVVKLAKKWRLPYRREESFDLCFVVNDVGSFIKRHLKLKTGKIINYHCCHSRLRFAEGFGKASESRNPESGSRVKPGMTQSVILGEHQGLPLYTIGQRKRLSISQGPWWVVKKDERKNILYVSNKERDLYRDECLVGQVNWLNGVTPKLPMKVWVKIRYKSEASQAVIRGIATRPARHGGQGARNDLVKVVFKKPQRAITPGQSAVFYTKTGEVLGGGMIK